MAPCAASAHISVTVFRSLRQLSYASTARQRTTPFLALGHTSYENGGILSKPDLSIRRCFRTCSVAYNPQSSEVENANRPAAGENGQAEGVTEQQSTHSDNKGATNAGSGGPKEKRVKPRRHRKDKPSTTQPASTRPPINYIKSDDPKKQEPWRIQKEALKQKFADGWSPRKKLPPDDLERIRHLHSQDPERYSTPVLSEHFKVSPEVIRRILKSKWRPTPEQMEKRRENYKKRHSKIWSQMAEIGVRPKRKSVSPYADEAVRETKPTVEPW